MRSIWKSRPALRALSVLLACGALLGCALRARGVDTGKFSIRAVIPDNQIDRSHTYFDLHMTPGQRQRLQVIVTNSQDTPLIAQVHLNSASTGQNGVLVYTDPDAATHSGLNIADVATLSTQELIIPANSSQSVEIFLSMPETLPEGILLGGVAVTERLVELPGDAPAGISVRNRVTYVIGLKLTLDGEEPEADFSLQSVVPGLVNFRTAVVVTLRNNPARLVKGMQISALVFQRGSNVPLHSLSLASANMAPCTDGTFIIDWENKPLKAGVYLLSMTADYQDGHWEWEEEFTITNHAAAINRDAVELQPDPPSLLDYWPLWLALLICSCAFTYWLGALKRRKEHS